MSMLMRIHGTITKKYWGCDMPLYDFACNRCGHIETKFVPYDTVTDSCEECGGELIRMLGNTSFRLKGDGWAKDSYTKRKENNE